MALLERKEEILKPKEIKAEIEPAETRIITITVYTQNVFNLKAFFYKHNYQKCEYSENRKVYRNNELYDYEYCNPITISFCSTSN
jgi:hypothetical protein